MNEDEISQALPAEYQARRYVADLRSGGATFRRALHSALAYLLRDSVLSKLAERLREYFCSGPAAVLLNRGEGQDLRSFRCLGAARGAAGRTAL